MTMDAAEARPPDRFQVLSLDGGGIRGIFSAAVLAGQVAAATSVAPTFFPAFSLPEDHVRLVDGGVWANNPAMVGVVEAASMFGQSLHTIRVLSLGTTADPLTRRRKLDNGGLLQWVREPSVVNVLLTGQSVGAFRQVQHLLGRDNVHRLDPPAPAGLTRLD